MKYLREKGKIISYALVVISISFLFGLAGCSFIPTTHPYTKNTHWQSQEPYLSVKAIADISDLRKWTFSGRGELVWQEETIDIFLEFETNTFSVRQEDSQETDLPLFSGEWAYSADGAIVMQVEHDALMNGRYATITLQPVGEALGNGKLFLKKYPYEKHTMWHHENPKFLIYQTQIEGEWRALGDKLVWEDKVLGITTIFHGEQFFVVSSLEEQEMGYPEILFSGIWEYKHFCNMEFFIRNIAKSWQNLV